MGEAQYDTDVLVLGGGLSGLAVAHYLGGRCTVLEAEHTPGGLCRSFTRDGFTYDIGGHIIFSTREELVREMVGWLGENVAQRMRQNKIWYRDRLVKYPFENGLAALEKQEIVEILLTFVQREERRPANFEEWCLARFGQGLSEKYLLPYNRKIWKRDLRTMSSHWVDRIPSPSLEEVFKSAVGIETEGYTHQLYFHYPRRGGIEGLIHALAARCPSLHTGFRVRHIHRAGERWQVSDGKETLTCRTLINTMPIFDLLPCLQDVPAAVAHAVQELQYNALLVVMVGVKHEGLVDTSAIYLPDPQQLAHRLCFMRHFAPANAPDGCSHLIAEITVPPDDPLYTTPDSTLVERVVADVNDVCGFTADEVISSDVKRIRYAYPIYDLDHQRNTGIFRDYLSAQRIYSTGRFANFEYINMDQCVSMARALVQNMAKVGEVAVSL